MTLVKHISQNHSEIGPDIHKKKHGSIIRKIIFQRGAQTQMSSVGMEAGAFAPETICKTILLSDYLQF